MGVIVMQEVAKRVDYIYRIKSVIAMMRNLNHPFKLMIGREVAQQLIEQDPPEFFEDARQDRMRFDGVPMVRNDSVEGVWLELQ